MKMVRDRTSPQYPFDKKHKVSLSTMEDWKVGHKHLLGDFPEHKIGVAESPFCQLYGKENETSTHILCYCPAVRDKHQTLTGYFSIDVAVM